MRKTLAVVLGATLCAVALTACSPGGSGTGTNTGGPVSKDLGSDPITIKLISTPESGGLAKDAIPGFEKLHPNVTVKYTDTGFSDYNTNLNLELSGDDAPDIALLNGIGNTVKDKLVMNLDDYATLYGWDKVYSDTQLASWRVADDGIHAGQGHLYAAAAGASIVGIFYNKSQLSQLGLQPPRTEMEISSASCRRIATCRAFTRWPARPATVSSRSASESRPAASAPASFTACSQAIRSKPS